MRVYINRDVGKAVEAFLDSQGIKYGLKRDGRRHWYLQVRTPRSKWKKQEFKHGLNLAMKKQSGYRQYLEQIARELRTENPQEMPAIAAVTA